MINAISGLPAIVVDTFRELQAEIEKNADADYFKAKEKLQTRKENSTNELKSKSLNRNESSNELPKYEHLAEKLKDILSDNDMTLEFSLDKDTNEMILKIIDSSTKEVVRQLPPELTLRIAKYVANMVGSGSLTNARI